MKILVTLTDRTNIKSTLKHKQLITECTSLYKKLYYAKILFKFLFMHWMHFCNNKFLKLVSTWRNIFNKSIISQQNKNKLKYCILNIYICKVLIFNIKTVYIKLNNYYILLIYVCKSQIKFPFSSRPHVLKH